MLNDRIIKWAEANGLLPEFQCGFRKNRSCADNVFVLNGLMNLCLNKLGGKLYALFVDFRRAFPSVNHNILWRMLSNLVMNSKMIRILIFLYSRATMLIRNSSGLSDPIDITEEVLQGEVLSPILFALFPADLEDFLIRQGIKGAELKNMLQILLLAYANDIVFLMLTVEEMNKILGLLWAYCEENLLQVNTDKTNIIIFKKGGRNARNLSFLYGQSEIKIVKKYTYLGVTFDTGGLFKWAAEEFYQKASIAVQATIKVINRAKINKLQVVNKLFESLVASIIEYSSHIWAVRHLEVLDRLKVNFYKKLMLLPRNTPSYAVRAEFGLTALRVEVFKLGLNYLQKINNMSNDRYPKWVLSDLRDLYIWPDFPKYSWFSNFHKKTS